MGLFTEKEKKRDGLRGSKPLPRKEGEKAEGGEYSW